jgi:UDP-GlcNAc:undecaprenyl-phosphate/decaprenyl-phosphate GlcNAc-1-phosphate transferase
VDIISFIFSSNFLPILVTLGLSYFVSVSSIPVIITISRLKNLMDVPGDRSSHVIKTPTLGGVAIFASILISYFTAQGLWPSKEGDNIINLTIVAVVILFFLGVKDDILVLSPAKKMLLQVASSVLVIVGSGLKISNFYGIMGIYELPYWVGVLITIFIFIALINAMNLIDGIDGLAGGIGFLASFIFGLWFFLNGKLALVYLAAGVCGSILGFLKFNFSKNKKIFMGDTGSLILGFILTVFAVKYINLNIEENGSSAPILAIMVLAVPIFDTLRMFMVRIYNKKSPFEGDRNHLHHLLVDAGLTHFQTSLFLTVLSAVLVVIFYFIRNYVNNNGALLLVLFLFILYLIFCYFVKLRVQNLHPSKQDNMPETE